MEPGNIEGPHMSIAPAKPDQAPCVADGSQFDMQCFLPSFSRVHLTSRRCIATLTTPVQLMRLAARIGHAKTKLRRCATGRSQEPAQGICSLYRMPAAQAEM